MGERAIGSKERESWPSLGKGFVNLDCRYKKNYPGPTIFPGRASRPRYDGGRELSISDLEVRSGVGVGSFEMRKSRWVLWSWGAPQVKGIQHSWDRHNWVKAEMRWLVAAA